MFKVWIGLLGGVAVLAFGWLSWWLLTSVWLAWFLLPAADVKIALSSAGQPGQLFEESDVWQLPVAIVDTMVVAVSQSETATTWVLLPRLGTGHRSREALLAAGWQVERVGLMLRAQSAQLSEASSSLGGALRHTSQTVSGSRLPLAPLLVAEFAPERVAAASSVALVAAYHPAGILLQLAEGKTIAELTFEPLVSFPEPAAEFSLVVPGHALIALPASLQRQWDELLRQRLGLTVTTPAILRYGAQFSEVFVHSAGDQFALGVRGPGDTFATTVETWLANDARQADPERQWFQLPDGTLGQELVPGPTPDVVSTPDGGCRHTLNRPVPLAICASATRAVVASNLALAQVFPDVTNWQVALDLTQPGGAAALACDDTASLLQRLLCRFRAVVAQGSEQGAMVLLRTY